MGIMAGPTRQDDATDRPPDELFAVLGNELRMDTLLALWERYDPLTDDEAVPFSELYDAVDVDDTGQFNYHLEQLQEHLIEKVDDGYTFQPVGLTIVQSIIAGAGHQADSTPRPVDAICRRCGADTYLTYQDSRIFHVCTECAGSFADASFPDGAIWGQRAPPAALRSRDPEALFAALVWREFPRMAHLSAHVCPQCAGPLEHFLDVCEDHDPGDSGSCPACGYIGQVRANWVCGTCKFHATGSPSGLLRNHPAVIAFHWEHDIDFGYPYDTNSFEDVVENETIKREVTEDEAVLSRDPFRVRYTIQFDEAAIAMTLDEDLEVVDVDW